MQQQAVLAGGFGFEESSEVMFLSSDAKEVQRRSNKKKVTQICRGKFVDGLEC